MPFADAGGGVSGLLEAFSDDGAIAGKSSGKCRLDESVAWPVFATGKEIGDLQSRGGLPG